MVNSFLFLLSSTTFPFDLQRMELVFSFGLPAQTKVFGGYSITTVLSSRITRL